MRQRVADKIMNNVRIYPVMHRIYGSGRISKASCICLKRYARLDKRIKLFRAIMDKDPLLAMKLLRSNIRR